MSLVLLKKPISLRVFILGCYEKHSCEGHLKQHILHSRNADGVTAHLTASISSIKDFYGLELIALIPERKSHQHQSANEETTCMIQNLIMLGTGRHTLHRVPHACSGRKISGSCLGLKVCCGEFTRFVIHK